MLSSYGRRGICVVFLAREVYRGARSIWQGVLGVLLGGECGVGFDPYQGGNMSIERILVIVLLVVLILIAVSVLA